MTVIDRPREQLEPFVQRMWRPLVTLATGLTGSLAAGEDIVQDVFEAVHRRGLDLAMHSSPEGYLRVAVVNRCRSYHRRGFVRRRYENGLGRADALRVVPAVDESHVHVVRAVARLPQRQREVIVLRYWCDLSFAEIAELLGMPASTARSLSQRAVRSLAHQLEEQC